MHKGQHCSPETKHKISVSHLGELNPMFGKSPANEGKTCSAESRQRMRDAKLGKPGPWRGKHRTVETREKISNALRGERSPNFGKPLSEETRRKLSIANSGKSCPWQRGERNRFWRGGLSLIPYPVDWTASLRRSIRERDHYACQLCGVQQEDTAFPVHHVDYVKSHCDPQNLVTLCPSCHMKTNQNREHWTMLFQMKSRNP